MLSPYPSRMRRTHELEGPVLAQRRLDHPTDARTRAAGNRVASGGVPGRVDQSTAERELAVTLRTLADQLSIFVSLP